MTKKQQKLYTDLYEIRRLSANIFRDIDGFIAQKDTQGYMEIGYYLYNLKSTFKEIFDITNTLTSDMEKK